MPPVPTVIKLVALVTGLVVLLSALATGAAALTMPLFVQGQRPAWMLFGFEAVILVAGVLAVLQGRGRFRDGPGLALAIFAGTILAGSAFGYLSAGKQLGSTSLTPLLMLRVVAAGVLGAAAACCVLSRNPRSWRVATLGVALGSPFAALIVAMLLGPARRAVLAFLTGGGLLQTGVAVLGVVVIGGLLCASVHFIIRAFEMGRIDGTGDCPGCGYNWSGLAQCPECGRSRTAAST